MGFAASLIILLLLIFLIVVAIVFFKVGQGKIGLTSGLLTYSPVMRIFGRVYPIILLIALIAYYALPFEHLYRGDESTYTDPSLIWRRDRYWVDLTVEDLTSLKDSGELSFEIIELPFEQKQLVLALQGFLGKIFVEQTPSAEGTIVLQYYPGALYSDGYWIDEFIYMHAEDFVLSNDGRSLGIKGMDTLSYKDRAIPFTLWNDPSIAGQFWGDNYRSPNRASAFADFLPILILQVPEQVTIVSPGGKVFNKGEFLDRGEIH